MNWQRKLELIAGLVTLLIAIAFMLLLLWHDKEAAVRLDRDFRVHRSLLVGVLIFILPGMLVSAGAYLHVIKNSILGQFAVCFGALLILVLFLLLLFAGVFYGLNVLFWVDVLMAFFAVVSVVVSVLVQKQAVDYLRASAHTKFTASLGSPDPL